MRRDRQPHAIRALVVYLLAWLAAAGAVVLVLVVTLDGDRSDDVPLPPVEQAALVAAARAAGCELRRESAGERLRPAVSGPAGRTPVGAGVYERPPPEEGLVAALRRGTVAIHVRPGVDDDRVDELRRLQEAFPNATIVIVNQSAIPRTVVATAYRRQLGCDRLDDAVFEALRLFHGRFLGTGPDVNR